MSDSKLMGEVRELPLKLVKIIMERAKLILVQELEMGLAKKLRWQLADNQKYHHEAMREEIERHALDLQMIGRDPENCLGEYEPSDSPVEDASDSTETSFVDASCSIAEMKKNLEKIEKEIEELIHKLILQERNNENELQELKEDHQNEMYQLGY